MLLAKWGCFYPLSSWGASVKMYRSALDRFLVPNNDKVLLETVQRAATDIGKRVSISLEDNRHQPA
jgi:hypothetical protein